MDSAVLTAVVAALALVVGGLVAALSARNVENMRVRSGLVEKAEERKLAASEAFLLAVTLWVDKLVYFEEFTEAGDSQDDVDEYNRRQRARDEAYRHLLLLASEPLYEWLIDTYKRAEIDFKETYVEQVRHFRRTDLEAQDQRRKFMKVLREDLIQELRPEVAALREPLIPGSTWRGRRNRTTRVERTGQDPRKIGP